MLTNKLLVGTINTDLLRYSSTVEQWIVRKIGYPVSYGVLSQIWAGTMPEAVQANGEVSMLLRSQLISINTNCAFSSSYHGQKSVGCETKCMTLRSATSYGSIWRSRSRNGDISCVLNCPGGSLSLRFYAQPLLPPAIVPALLKLLVREALHRPCARTQAELKLFLRAHVENSMEVISILVGRCSMEP